jgi:predicted phosphodiesterase
MNRDYQGALGARRIWALVLIVCQHAYSDDADPLPWVEGSTTVAVLPDTQRYAQKYPEIFEAQTKWIAASYKERRIAYVLHLGDITQSDVAEEWEVATRSLELLDGKVPYLLVPGNHDYHEERASRISEYFPVSKMETWPTFGGVFEEGKLENSYHLARFGTRDWILLALEYGPRDEVLRWANDVLKEHSSRFGLLVTHAYLFRDNVRYDHTSGEQRANPYGFAGNGNDGEQMWQKLVRKHPNMMIVISGHVRTGGPTGSYLASEGDYGNTVHQMMTDYQKLPRGGMGYLRLLEFLPDGKTVQVRTYSPTKNRSRVSPFEDFTFELRGPTRDEPRPRRRAETAPAASSSRG